MLLKLFSFLSLTLIASASNPCSPDWKDISGFGCSSVCPLNSGSNGEQCVCSGGFKITTDQASCECQTGYLDIAQSSCLTSCPALTLPSGKACVCKNPFSSDGSNCVCSGTNRVNLKGDGCISACPKRSTNVNGQCICDNTFTKSSNGQMCICQVGFLDPDGNYCMSQCPNGSTDIGEGICKCDNPNLSGDFCTVCNGVASMDGVTCLATCPPNSSPSMMQCVCGIGYEPNQNKDACICSGGNLVDLDGVSCVAFCSPGGEDANVDGFCECINGFSGVNCNFCTGVMGVDGTTCMPSCPDFSSPDGFGGCSCDGSLAANGNACDCGGLLVDIDGVSCVGVCSFGTDSNGDGICECANGFSGATCADCTGVIGLDWSCVTSCPEYSALNTYGICSCYGSLIPSGNSCGCNAGELISIDEARCVSECPDRSSESNGLCECDFPFVLIVSSGVCGCANGAKISLDGSTCLAMCPSNSSPVNGKCTCDYGYLLDGSDCTTTCSVAKNLLGTACISQCPTHSINVAGQCSCLASFQISGDGQSCVCTGTNDKMSVDGWSCITSCPARSSLSNGKCVCDPAFQANGNTCGCYTGLVVNLPGTGCIIGCPQYSSVVNGACQCYTGFTVAGDLNSCECTGGKSISVDGISCEIGCSSAHSSVVGTQCVCDDNFVQLGSNCLCDVDKVLNIVGDYCIDNCPRGSFLSSGKCQCYGAFVINGNACECPVSDPFVSIDGTGCESICPTYSSDNNGQCACFGTFVKNGNTCECPTGKKINLAGTACVDSCPTHSSDQGGQCQCNSPRTLETTNKASCVCMSSLQLSLDGLNCITPCPDYTMIVDNACVCNSVSGFILSSDKQSCECQVGKAYDSISGSCLVACSSLSPPNNVYPSCYECDGTCKTCSGPSSNECLTCNSGAIFDPTTNTCLPSCPSLSAPNNIPPYCFECDSSCKTCSGPNSNECLTCYSGYQLSTSNTCSVVKTTPTKSSTSVEVAKTTKTMSSASLAASSVASVGNSGAIRVSLVGNMFQYLKFLNISYSEDLSDMLENLSSQFLPFMIDVGIPSSMTDEGNYKTLPYQFTKYEEIHPSFLMNFWDDLSILVVVIGIVGVLVGLHFVANKFYKQKTLWKLVFSKGSLMAQSFLLTYTYNNLGNIIFFGLLDFKSAKKYSGVHVLNLIIAISLLLTEVGILTLHYTLLMKYRKIKRARLNPNRTKEIEEFLGKHENLKAFFEDFNDFSFIQQCFLLVAIFRDMLCNLILVTLYQYPLAESSCFVAFSVLMIVYILYCGPFKDILNAIQQILCEGILLLVNTSVFVNAVLDHINSNDDDLRKKLGSIVVISNTVFNFVPIAFLTIALWQFSKELYAYLKGWMNKRKMPKSMKKEELSLKSDSSKMILKDLSLEGPIRNSVSMIGEESRNTTTGIIIQQQHKWNEDLELSQYQMTNLESKVMSKDNSGIFEMKLNGDQGLIIENAKEKSNDWPNSNRMRKMKIKKRRMFPSLQQNALNVGDNGGVVKLEEANDVSK